MRLHDWRRIFFGVTAVGAIVFVIAAMQNSRPHLHAANTDWAPTIQAIAALVTAIAGLLGVLGLRKPSAEGNSAETASSQKCPGRFRQVGDSYQGDDIVIVEVYEGRDDYGKAVFRNIECRPIR